MINKKKIFEEQIPVLLFIQPYRVGATYDSVDETPKCNPLKWKLLSSIIL